jgi:hypothetical protein
MLEESSNGRDWQEIALGNSPSFDLLRATPHQHLIGNKSLIALSLIGFPVLTGHVLSWQHLIRIKKM